MAFFTHPPPGTTKTYKSEKRVYMFHTKKEEHKLWFMFNVVDSTKPWYLLTPTFEGRAKKNWNI